MSDLTYRRFGVERERQRVWLPDARRFAPVAYFLEDGMLHIAFPHAQGCRQREHFATRWERTIMVCVCRLQPMVASLVSPEVFIELFPTLEDMLPLDVLEVDYSSDLDDAPTFTEALAALEAHKARRAGVAL